MSTFCPLCHHSNSTLIYQVDNLPLFQNVVFDTEKEAIDTKTVNVHLHECQECGFICNINFDESLMVYDRNYQNEQGLSPSFKEHLNHVRDLFEKKGYKNKSIVEVGCGKAFFLSKLLDSGFSNVRGYDPAYEGDLENVIPTYFDKTSTTGDADLIVLRHVLEHIADPLAFLKMIAEANNYHGDVYIEVPDFDWIKNNGAFWDIYNEHCNYFSSDSLQGMFEDSEIYSLFEKQYIGVFARLSCLKDIAPPRSLPKAKGDYESFLGKIDYFRSMIESQTDQKRFIWCAGSKGVIFCNILDKTRKLIDGVIDINPKKQGKYVGGTGHPVFSPSHIESLVDEKLLIFVTNGNYLREIQNSVNHNAVRYEVF